MLIDLTMELNENTPVYPGDPKPSVTRTTSIDKQGWNEHSITMSAHNGTHIDAPWHMIEGGKKLSEVPLETFIGEAILLECRGEGEINPDAWEVKEGDIVVLKTGHNEKIGEEYYYTNNPVVSRSLAQEFVDRKVKMVGIDSFSVDNPPFEVHKLLLKNNITILENLVGLEEIEKKRFKLYAFPLKLEHDGAPCRAVAEI